MPKVNLKRDAPLNKVASDFYRCIRARYPKEKFCTIMGYSRTADYCRCNKPECFRLEELRILYREGEEVFSRDTLDEMFLKMLREEKK